MKYFFTSDMHLGHANIIKYCQRTLFMSQEDRLIYDNLGIDKKNNFKISQDSLNKMNNELIRRWNERVKAEDTVFYIGDFCFKSKSERGEGIGVNAKEWESQLNGNIIFIKGNHDKNNSCNTRIQSLQFKIDGRAINLIHNPEEANIDYAINFTGHVHNNWEIKRFKLGFSFTDCINVGVDVWNFYPVTYKELIRKYRRWIKEKRDEENIEIIC